MSDFAENLMESGLNGNKGGKGRGAIVPPLKGGGREGVKGVEVLCCLT